MHETREREQMLHHVEMERLACLQHDVEADADVLRASLAEATGVCT